MLFDAIRIILWLAISIFAVFKIRHSRIVRKKLITILTVVLCLLLTSVSGMFPVENLFINFKSPVSVFNYTNTGKIDEIIYGQESCMVIYTKDNAKGHYIVPKAEKGYKIPSYFGTRKISHKFDESGLFDVYNVRGTEDYYVVGSINLKENENEIEIFNKKEKVESNIIRVGNTDFIYFFLNDFSKEYYLVVNGEKITISN
jgi:hypothetical protein